MARFTSKSVEELLNDVDTWLKPEAQDEGVPAYTLLLGSGFSWPLIPTAGGLLKEVPWWQYWNARRGKSLPDAFAARPDAGQPHHQELRDFEHQLWGQIAARKDSGVVLKDQLPDLSGPDALAKTYTAVMEGRGGLYFPEMRRRFLRAVIGRVGRQINEAHLFLASILQMQDAQEPEMRALWGDRRAFCRTIFTTNFDPLLQRSLQLVGKLYLVSDRPEVLEEPDDDSEAISLVYTHGSALRYRQLNTRAELELAMKRNAGALKKYFERHGVIVIGYSGWADTTMEALASCEEFNGQLYWVDIHEPGAAEQALAPHVVKFLEERPDNRFYVPAKADALLGALHRGLGLGPTPRCFADPIGFRLEQLRAVTIPHRASAAVATNAGAAVAGRDASSSGVVAGEVGAEPTQSGTSQQTFLHTILERLASAKAFFDQPDKHNDAIVREALAAKFMTELTHAALEGDLARTESLSRVMLALPDLDPRKRYAALFARGMARIARGEFEPAIADLSEVVGQAELPPDTNAIAQMHRGLAFDATHDFERALADFSAVIDAPAAPGATRAQAFLARGARRMTSVAANDALLDFTAAFELPEAEAATRGRAAYNRGVVRMQLGDTIAAAADFTAAIEIEGVEPEIRAFALNNRGMQRLSSGARDTAREDFERALAVEGSTGQARAMARNNRGLMALGEGRYAQALEDFDALVDAPDVAVPGKLLARTNRAFAYNELRRYDAALEEANAVIGNAEVAPDTLASARLNRGRTLLAVAQPQAAIKDFDAVLALPKLTDELRIKAHYNRALANVALDDAAHALEDLELVIAAPGAGAELRTSALVQRGTLLYSGGKIDAAIENWTQVIDTPAASAAVKASTLFQRALAQFQSTRLEPALTDMSAALDAPELPAALRPAAFLWRGKFNVAKGERGAAIEDFTRVLELPEIAPEVRAEALELRAGQFDALADTARENADWEALLAIPQASGDQRGRALVALGVNQARGGEAVPAQARFEAAIADAGMPPAVRAQAWFLLGVLFAEKPERLADAVDAYTHAIDSDGVTPERKAMALVNRAHTRLAQEQQPAALADLAAVLALEGAPLEQRVKALRNRIDVHAQRKDWRAAIEDCTAILALTDDEAARVEATVGRAWYAYENGDLAGLIEDSRAALALDPAQENALFNLALGLALSGDAAALAEYERACNTAPSREVIEASLRDLESALAKRGPVARSDEMLALFRARLAQQGD